MNGASSARSAQGCQGSICPVSTSTRRGTQTISTHTILILAAAAACGLSLAAFAAGPAPAPLPPSNITLYEKPNFQGRSMTFSSRVASLNAVGFNDLAQSVKIDGKRDWVLCEGRNFLGRCIRVHLKERDLKRQKFSGLASSIYPVPDPRPAKPN